MALGSRRLSATYDTHLNITFYIYLCNDTNTNKRALAKTSSYFACLEFYVPLETAETCLSGGREGFISVAWPDHSCNALSLWLNPVRLGGMASNPPKPFKTLPPNQRPHSLQIPLPFCPRLSKRCSYQFILRRSSSAHSSPYLTRRQEKLHTIPQPNPIPQNKLPATSP